MGIPTDGINMQIRNGQSSQSTNGISMRFAKKYKYDPVRFAKKYKHRDRTWDLLRVRQAS